MPALTRHHGRPRWADYLLLLALASLWGASYTFIKIGVATIPPVTFIAARTAVAAMLLVAVAHLRGIRLPRDLGTWRQFAFQAVMNSVVPFTLIAWAERTVDAGLAAILNSTSPIFTFLITWMVTRHEPTSPRKFLGVAAGLVGIMLIIGFDALRGFGTEIVAELAIVAATLCYAGAAIFGRRFHGLDPMAPAAGSLVVGAVLLAPLSLWVDRPWTLQPSTASLAALFGLAIFSTAVAFVIYFSLLKSLGSVGTTSQAYLRVPIGVMIGAIFLGETLDARDFLGLALVVAGVGAMTFPGRAETRVSE